VIKQGDKIAHQKGWTRPKRERPAKAKAKGAKGNERARRKRSTPPSPQGSLFPDLLS